MLTIPFIFLLNSCDSEHEIEPINTDILEVKVKDSEIENPIDADQLLEDFSRLFAKSLNDAKFRSSLKEEALKMYDGDYNIFFNSFLYYQLSENYLVKNLLSDTYISDMSNSRTSGSNVEEWLKQLSEAYPNLQVSVPVNIEDWDVDSFIPPVTFLTDDFDEATHIEIKAFDVEGNEFLINTVDEPDYPVVVISRSERVDDDGNLIRYSDENFSIVLKNNNSINSEIVNVITAINAAPAAPSSLNVIHGSANYLMLTWNDLPDETGYEVYRSTGGSYTFLNHLNMNNNSLVTLVAAGQKYFYQVRGYNSDGYGAWSNIVSTFGSSRNDGESLKMKRMRFTESALQAVESWTAGAPEIRIRIAVGSPTSAVVVYTSGKLEPQHRNDIKDKWWNKQVDMLNSWNMGYHGTVLTMNFREEDSGAKHDWSFDVHYEDKSNNSTIKHAGKVSFKDDRGDKGIANESIFWWQSKDMIYTQNGFSWQFVY